ncbi:MAG: FAD binding domain-containing protein [Gemmataceae bacterium]|nr:FAD binding domain-containing protein [Gemmataceae bacterium]MCI0739472.1 FAD binding domain-containing protein [Gemmataceae bacterium]
MKNFTYFRPTTPEQAVALLENRWGNTELLAGGTDLHDLQKEYVAQPARVVSLSGVNALAGIRVEEKSVRIGAGAKLADIANHAELKRLFPSLTDAADQIGGPQIRNMGTLGGNLCQRNRCWYFRDEHTNCLLKTGQRCFALDGENKYHAIFSQGHRCVIVNPSTLAPALIALGASAVVQGPNGRRTIELGRFFRAPGANNEREHVLEANDMVVEVTIPRSNLANASYEVRHKQAYDWPLVQAAVSFERGDGGVRNPRVVLGHVAPTPHVAEAAARSITGQAVSEATAGAAGRAAAQDAKPLSQNGYKVKLVEVAVKRALIIAAGQKRYWEV